MKTIAVILLLLCASLINVGAQQLSDSNTKYPAKIVDTAYIWPDSLKGTYVNIPAIVVDHQGWIYAAAVGNGFADGLVWRSKNKGKSWEHLTKGLEDVFLAGATSIYMLNDGTLLVSGLSGIWRSLDYGDTWQRVLYDGGGSGVWCFIQTSADTVFAGGATIWESTNRGATWNYIDEMRLPRSTFWPIDGFTMDKNGNLFASLNGVLKSTDSGRTWFWSNQGGPWLDGQSRTSAVTADSFSGSIFVGSSNNSGDEKVFRLNNKGAEWKEIPNPGSNYPIYSFAVSEKYGVFMGGRYPGLFNSVDDGNTWSLIGLQEAKDILSLSWLGEDTLLVGTSDGMYIVTLDKITGIEEDPKMPENFTLSQNYPNPFNPTTSIKYQIASSKYVTLAVYDILGKEVTTLVDEEKSAGSYEATFNASGLSSGVYFYRIQAGNFTETKKMLLLK